MKITKGFSFSFRLLLSASVMLLACGYNPTTQTSTLDFYGSDTYQAILEYQTFFEIPAEELSKSYNEQITSPDELDKKDQMLIDTRTRYHTKFLAGAFTYHTKPIDYYSYSASVEELDAQDYEINNVALSEDQTLLRVYYSYKNIGVFSKYLFNKKSKTKIRFYLPLDPDSIYKFAESFSTSTFPNGRPIVPCTSTYDNSEAAFYYYWSPDLEGCPRKEFIEKLVLVEGTIEPMESTKRTYPRYGLLYGKKEPISVSIVYGIDKSMSDPKDLGRLAFELDSQKLINMKKNNVDKTFRLTKKTKNNTYLTYDGTDFSAKIHLILLDPESTKAFDKILAKKFQDDDVFIYSGHSSDDYYFDLDRIYSYTKNQKLPAKYQIIFNNSCTSYPFFNKSFVANKPNGIVGIDLILNGIGADFYAEDRNYQKRGGPELILLTSVLGLDMRGKRRSHLQSWQEIMDTMYNRVGFNQSPLSVLLADEDNPTSLREALLFE